ncbi:MAG: hypothetical protein KDJ38_10090 [Gammaproteobacteria bacterium]|nr:hypothetical protein [Gammaproteobacteria bacterium]
MAKDEASDKPERRRKRKAGKKDAQLLIRINSEERDVFLDLCEELDTSAAREIRKFIRSFVLANKNDVD